MFNELESINFVNYCYFNVSVIKLRAIAKCVYAKNLSHTASVVGIYDVQRIQLFRGRALSTTQKMKFSIKDIFSKCDQTLSFLRIWTHFLKKSLMENFVF